MQPYPHHYVIQTSGTGDGPVTITAVGAPQLATSAPPEFGGPGGMWSPETLLCAAVGDCFVLGFRAVARASHLEWTRLSCTIEGTLERLEGVSRFTRFVTTARLEVPAGTDVTRARAVMEKAEQVCLVSNSLNGERRLVAEVRTASD